MLVGTKVRFFERYRPEQVRCGAIGVVVDIEERPAPNSGSDYWVRARFGDFITPWIGAWQLERVSLSRYRLPPCGRDLQPKDLHTSAAGHRLASPKVSKPVKRQLGQHREVKAVRQQDRVSAAIRAARQEAERAALFAGQRRHCTPVMHQHRGSETFDIADAGPGEVHNPDSQIFSCAVGGLQPQLATSNTNAACMTSIWSGVKIGPGGPELIALPPLQAGARSGLSATDAYGQSRGR
jgi:hypothetical protein